MPVKKHIYIMSSDELLDAYFTLSDQFLSGLYEESREAIKNILQLSERAIRTLARNESADISDARGGGLEKTTRFYSKDLPGLGDDARDGALEKTTRYYSKDLPELGDEIIRLRETLQTEVGPKTEYLKILDINKRLENELVVARRENLRISTLDDQNLLQNNVILNTQLQDTILRLTFVTDTINSIPFPHIRNVIIADYSLRSDQHRALTTPSDEILQRQIVDRGLQIANAYRELATQTSSEDQEGLRNFIQERYNQIGALRGILMATSSNTENERQNNIAEIGRLNNILQQSTNELDQTRNQLVGLQETNLMLSSEASTLRERGEELILRLRNNNASQNEFVDTRNQSRILENSINMAVDSERAHQNEISESSALRIRELTEMNIDLRLQIENSLVSSSRQLQALKDTVRETVSDINVSDNRLEVFKINSQVKDSVIDMNQIDDSKPLEYAFAIFNLEPTSNRTRFLMLLWQLRRSIDVNDIYNYMGFQVDQIAPKYKHFTNDYVRLITEAQHMPPYRQRYNISKYLRSILYNTTDMYKSGLVNESDFLAAGRKNSILIYTDKTLEDLKNYRQILELPPQVDQIQYNELASRI